MGRIAFLVTCAAAIFGAVPAPVQDIALRKCLVIPSVGRYGRAPIHTDAIEAQVVGGKWVAPSEGDPVSLPDGSVRKWQEATSGTDGWLSGPALNGGYAYWAVESPEDRIALLEASGHNMVYANGEPRGGDPYQNGYLRLPISLRKGRNDFLFHCGRGRLKASLAFPTKSVMLDTRDATLPDILVSEREPLLGALVVINAGAKPLKDLIIRASGGQLRTTDSPLPVVPPRSIRKVGFRFQPKTEMAPGTARLQIELREKGQKAPLDTCSLDVRVRAPSSTYKRTFLSSIDGSVQYYAVNPGRSSGSPGEDALYLTLHGASVEAIGQADAYSPNHHGVIVAPTNRRPFGFDWEDWGRMDALEVLEEAVCRFKPDPHRIYLTGHSMGGHGTWHLGTTYPDKFAAIGPSAGWISFGSYGGGIRYSNPNPMEEMLLRATSPSDTLARIGNLSSLGVYILHGDADDNVPVREARTMRDELSKWHKDLHYHEQPGAGHWWENSPEPGAECVDWPPMFDLFARRAVPATKAPRRVQFSTANPGISASCFWVTIDAQIKPLRHSSVDIQVDPLTNRYRGKTENVERLLITNLTKPNVETVTIELDNTRIEAPRIANAGEFYLVNEAGKWSISRDSPKGGKNRRRSGPFKEAFSRRMMFVYGTRGTAQENRWAFAKARYDSETFWYRGNGSIDVIPDSEFETSRNKGRNIILYGNSDTNGAWQALLRNSPVQVDRKGARIGGREVVGDNLACLFIQPRPAEGESSVQVGETSVGVVSGTGLPGLRLTDRMPYFVSGVAYPDCILIGSDSLASGTQGVRAAGFFGNDWQVETGEWVWQTPMKGESRAAD